MGEGQQSRVKTQARYIFLDSPINGGEMGS